MTVPTHSLDCKTLLWKTTCPDCAESVWFFSCSCGSKVFFDRPGGSWPRHDERCIPYLLTVLRAEGLSTAAVRARISEAAARRGQRVADEVARLLQEEEFAETRRETIVRVTPYDHDHVLEGRILSCNLQVNFLHRLNLEDTALGRAFVGKLLDEPYVEIRVRGSADPFSGVCVELDCFLTRRIYEKHALHAGCSVAVAVSPRTFRNRAVWVATHVERL